MIGGVGTAAEVGIARLVGVWIAAAKCVGGRDSVIENLRRDDIGGVGVDDGVFSPGSAGEDRSGRVVISGLVAGQSGVTGRRVCRCGGVRDGSIRLCGGRRFSGVWRRRGNSGRRDNQAGDDCPQNEGEKDGG